MNSILSPLVATLLAGTLAWVTWWVLGQFLRKWWPATIPDSLGFTQEIATDLRLREVAEHIAERFKPFSGDGIVCLGTVRGTAARVLFHAGAQNKRGNIWRPDYMIQVERVQRNAVRLRLVLNHPYSYLRLNKSELEALRQRLMRAFSGLDRL